MKLSHQFVGLALLVTLLAAAGCENVEWNTPGSGKETHAKPKALFALSSMHTVTDKTPPTLDRSILDTDGETLRFQAGANETVSLQLILDAPPPGLDNVQLLFTPVTKPNLASEAATPASLPASIFTGYRMLPVSVRTFPAWFLRLADETPTPAGYYDPLVPITASTGGQPYRLAPNERLAMWVDLTIPRSALPGLYEGKLTVTFGPKRAAPARTIPLAIHVLDYVLPDASPLRAVGGFDHRNLLARFLRRNGKPFAPEELDPNLPELKPGLAKIRQLMTLAHDHRLDLFDRALRPQLRRDLHGKLQLWWDHYDAIAKPYLDGSAFDDQIGVKAWPVPFSDTWPVPKYYGGVGSKHYEQTVETFLTQCIRHFRDLHAKPDEADDDEAAESANPYEKILFAWPCRQAPSQQAYTTFAQVARAIDAAAPRLPILSTLPPNPPKRTGWSPPANFAKTFDILAPRTEWLDPNEAEKRLRPQTPLAGVWLSPGQSPYGPNLTILASPADICALPWLAVKYPCTGLFVPDVLDWPLDTSAMPADAAERLFYPGTPVGLDAVLPSVRLKRLRRAIEDLAALRLLQKRNPAVAQTLLDSMVRYVGLASCGDNYLDPKIEGWVHDPALWTRARHLLQGEVADAIARDANLDIPPHRQQARKVKWTQFRDAVSRIRVERIRAHIRPGELPMPIVANNTTPGPKADTPTTKSLRATIELELFNEHPREVPCHLRIHQLPPQWKSIIGEYDILRFAPRQERTAKLVVEGFDIPSTPTGKMPVGITIHDGQRPAEQAQKRIAEIAFLAAGRFNAPPTIDGKLKDWPARSNNAAGGFRLVGRPGQKGTGRAKRQTHVFVMQDKTHLYFAFRCEEPTPKSLRAKRSNVVTYQQLLAVGEDLIEILLDPGATATGPEDLYRILVKANGVSIQELGISCQPRLGASQPVPLNAKIATGRTEDAWIVEIAIPRAGFGDEGKKRFWGVNFTRFATPSNEASSWTGAERYFYDPKSLGTMFVPPAQKP